MSDRHARSAAATRVLWGRRVAIGALLLWGAYMVLWPGLPQVCHGTVVTPPARLDVSKPSDLVVPACEPMGMASPAIVLFLLALLLLLLPELAEIEIPGVLRIKRDIDGAKSELASVRQAVADVKADLRAQALAANTSRQDVTVNNYVARAQETGEALTADRRSTPDNEGSYAQMAFGAGMAGLSSLLASWGDDVRIIGYTVGLDRNLRASYTPPDTPPELVEEVLQVLTEFPVDAPLTAMQTADGRWWAAGAPALDDDGSCVGALAAAVQVTTRSAEPSEEMGAEVEEASQAYARLLIDLIGETGRLDTRRGT